MSTFFSAFGALTDSNISMVMLLVKATVILLVALGITLSMQRASAGARHLVWLVTVAALLLVPVGADPGENASTGAGVNAGPGARGSG